MARVKLTDEERKQRRNEAGKRYYEKIKSNKKEYSQQYYLSNKEERIAYVKKYRQQYDKNRSQIDPVFKLTYSIRHLILAAFQNQGYTKQSSTSDILGCTWDEFKQHIESQFEPWMHWGNRGGRDVLGLNMTWDLDHITPISSAVTEDDVKRLNHYTNFQPLCSHVNRFVKRNNV